MKPIYENIDVAIDHSFKVAIYNHSKTCESTHWHIHPEYELVYVKNGSGVLRLGTKTITYDDGALLFLGPNIPHADFGNKEHPNNLEVVIQFGKEFLEEKLPVFPEFKKVKQIILSTDKIIIFDNLIKKELAQDFERFENLNGLQRLANFISILDKLTNTTLYRILLTQSSPTSNKTIEVTRLEAVFEYVNKHYSRDISSQTLASHLGLTTNSFCRFFKKMTNQTFIQFLNEFRVRRALELFDENLYSISEVMYQCGFNDASYFTKQFKKHQRMTPSYYLAQIA